MSDREESDIIRSMSTESDSTKNPTHPCPRCVQKGVEPPNDRAMSRSGKRQGYCADCSREYQRDRNRARAIAVNATMHTLAELQWASEFLTGKPVGRPSGQNTCPKCGVAEKAPGQSYCKECGNKYRTELRERKNQQVEEFKSAPIRAALKTLMPDEPDPEHDQIQVELDEAEQADWERLAKEEGEELYRLSNLGPPQQSRPATTNNNDNPFGLTPEDIAALEEEAKRNRSW